MRTDTQALSCLKASLRTDGPVPCLAMQVLQRVLARTFE